MYKVMRNTFVNFNFNVSVSAAYNGNAHLSLGEIVENAAELAMQGNTHTIMSGVRCISTSKGEIYKKDRDLEVRVFSNEESCNIGEPYFDRVCKEEIEIGRLIERYRDNHKGEMPYLVEITIL